MDIKIELVAFGQVDCLRIAECPSEEPGPQEIRLRQEVIGVNFIDIYQRTGLYPFPPPGVLGVEGAGMVEAVGAEVGGAIPPLSIEDLSARSLARPSVMAYAAKESA